MQVYKMYMIMPVYELDSMASARGDRVDHRGCACVDERPADERGHTSSIEGVASIMMNIEGLRLLTEYFVEFSTSSVCLLD